MRKHNLPHEIFHTIKVQLVRKGGRLWVAGRKEIGFNRYCSFESKYDRCDRSLFLSLSLSLSLSIHSAFLFFWLFAPFSRPYLLLLLPTFVCKSRNECVSVRITNRKRFSYSPFIKSNQHIYAPGRTLASISVFLAFLSFHFVFLPPVFSSSLSFLSLSLSLSLLFGALLHAGSNHGSIIWEK